MKKPLIDMEIDGTVFHLLKEEKKMILSLVKKLAVEPENPFADLESRLPKYAISLRGARKRAGLSQRELAKKTGILVTNISKMENGERKIGEKLARRLAKALNISYKVLL